MKSSDIKERLKGIVTIIGIGNIMRGDDGFGPKLIESLGKKNTKANLFDCGTVPENYIFPILTTSCDTVILIDAADLKAQPGSMKILTLEELSGAGLSTHNSSIRLFTDLLRTGKDDLNIFAVTVQPRSIAFGQILRPAVLDSVDKLTDIFVEALA